MRSAFPANSTLRAETLQRAAERSKLYVVFLTPRSGSTWLTSLAEGAGLGVPHEWFNLDFIGMERPAATGHRPPRVRGTPDINAYVDAIVDEAPGVAGVELGILQALQLRELVEEPVPLDRITFFYLRRRDLLAQAVSYYRSITSGRWHSYEGCRGERPVDYDRDGIRRCRDELVDKEYGFEMLFRSCGIEPHRLYYEDLAADPLQVLQAMARMLGRPPADRVPHTPFVPLRDERSEAWRRRTELELEPAVRPDSC